jgi:hypothetical protein
MTEKQFLEITKWQEETFPASTAISKIIHLEEELIELVSEIKANTEHKRYEWADCFILLFGAAKQDGMAYRDIISCIDDKMGVNYKRKWGKPKENGVVNHLRNESETY